MASKQLRVELQRQNFSFQCAYVQVSTSGVLQITGREISFKVILTRRPGVLNGPYVIDFTVVKRTMEDICKQHTSKVLIPTLSPHFSIHISSDFVLVKESSKGQFSLPRGEVICMPVEQIVPETLAQYFASVLVEQLGLEKLQKCEVTMVTLYVDNGEYSAGYDVALPTARL